MSTPGKLRNCPECGSGWPEGPDFALRSCGWLHGLPHRITPSNSDVEIHDGWHGPDRFLRLELKSPRETWPLQTGQASFLQALARQPNWTVRVLRGTTTDLTIYRVTGKAIEPLGIKSHVEAVRLGVAAWLNGTVWRVVEEGLAKAVPASDHLCGWARVEGLWTCVQDARAVGWRPDTSCGKTAPEYA